MADELVKSVDGGYYREDGTFCAPEGWPEGAGWVVRNADGSIDQWGPASSLKLVAFAGDGTPAEPGDYRMVAKGVPAPEKPAETSEGE